MQALKQIVDIPRNHHLKLDFQLPATIPEGKTELLLVFQSSPQKPEPQRKKRVLGSRKGQIWMSDDFDAELPDEFWLGEDA
jgi:hypothetical protein